MSQGRAASEREPVRPAEPGHTKKLGVFGGTFDPIHLGHLILAEQARDQLRLDRVLLVPAAAPPHKRGRALSPARHRLEMVELATAGNDGLEASDLELARKGISYTVETLRALGAANADTELYLLLGSDNLADFRHWHEPVEIARLARLAVAARPGAPIAFDALVPPLDEHEAAQIGERVIQMPLVEISGTDIRARIARGRSIRYLVPAAVEAYIDAEGLYRAAEQ